MNDLLQNVLRDWRLALRFDEATRVEDRIKKMGSNFDPDAFIASHLQSVSTPLPSPDPAAKDLDFVPDAPSQAPQASSIPRARPVRSPSSQLTFDDLIPTRTPTPQNRAP